MLQILRPTRGGRFNEFTTLIEAIEVDMRTGDAGVPHQPLKLLQRISDHPAIDGRAGAARPLVHDRSDLLADQHGEHVDGEGMPAMS